MSSVRFVATKQQKRTLFGRRVCWLPLNRVQSLHVLELYRAKPSNASSVPHVYRGPLLKMSVCHVPHSTSIVFLSKHLCLRFEL